MAARPDRTEPATPKRRREVREKGQVARSLELVSACVLLGSAIALNAWLPTAVKGLADYMGETLARAHTWDLTCDSVGRYALSAVLTGVRLAAPPVLAAAGVGLAASALQVGMLFSLYPLMPSLARISPGAGLGRMFSGRAAVELVKSLAKVAVVGLVAFSTVGRDIGRLVAGGAVGPEQTIAQVWAVVYGVMTRAGAVLLVLGVADYAYQRKEFEDSIRMTKQEVRDEYRQLEGDPLVRSRIRGRQREIARHRMMREVARADLVVTNPTRIAVALRYDPDTMKAPKVVAKGQRLVADRIREIAAANGVPIVENKPLAQALFKAVDLDREIPVELYRAVAEVLAYVYRLKGGAGARGRGPRGGADDRRPGPVATRGGE